MEEITNDMIDSCLLFLQEQGGEVSRYSFDRFVTKNIREVFMVQAHLQENYSDKQNNKLCILMMRLIF